MHTLQGGGIETVLIELLGALDPDRYRVVLSVGFHLPGQEVLRDRIPAHVEVRYIVRHPVLTRIRRKKAEGYLHPAEKALGELLLPPIHKSLHRRALKAWSQEADVFIDFDTTLAPYAQLIPQRLRKIAYLHFSLAHTWNEQRSKRDKLARRLQRYDRVVMLCDEMKAAAAEMYPALAPKLVRIYNALDFARIRSRADEPVESLPRQPYFISLGRLQERQKDFTTVILAYAHGLRLYEWKEDLVLVGDGQSRPQLEQLVRDENLEGRVHFAGFQSNPYPWLKGARALLFGSKYEGLPTVLIEAHALGVPVVATACPTGVRELLMDGDAGMLVPVGDATAMCEAVQTMRADNALRARQRDAVRTLLIKFEVEEMLRGFDTMLDKGVQEKTGSVP